MTRVANGNTDIGVESGVTNNGIDIVIVYRKFVS